MMLMVFSSSFKRIFVLAAAAAAKNSDMCSDSTFRSCLGMFGSSSGLKGGNLQLLFSSPLSSLLLSFFNGNSAPKVEFLITNFLLIFFKSSRPFLISEPSVDGVPSRSLEQPHQSVFHFRFQLANYRLLDSVHQVLICL